MTTWDDVVDLEVSDGECQVCGCTDDFACVAHGRPCSWVLPGELCSACAPLGVFSHERAPLDSPAVGGGPAATGSLVPAAVGGDGDSLTGGDSSVVQVSPSGVPAGLEGPSGRSGQPALVPPTGAALTTRVPGSVVEGPGAPVEGMKGPSRSPGRPPRSDRPAGGG